MSIQEVKQVWIEGVTLDGELHDKLKEAGYEVVAVLGTHGRHIEAMLLKHPIAVVSVPFEEIRTVPWTLLVEGDIVGYNGKRRTILAISKFVSEAGQLTGRIVFDDNTVDEFVDSGDPKSFRFFGHNVGGGK